MPRTVTKTLTFPLGGVVRRGGYREQTRPYSAPWAVNVRGIATLEDRERGGSRPGLSTVSTTDLGSSITAMVPVVSIDSDGARDYDVVIIADGLIYRLQGSTVTSEDAALAINAVTLTIGGEEIVFPTAVSAVNPVGATASYSAAERAGKLYLADSVLRTYDPQTGIVAIVDASSGVIPTAQPVVSVYRDRIILTGANHLWYASRQGDPTDWHFGADHEDPGRAIAGQLAHAGRIGDTPNAVIPVDDKALVFGCENSLWVVYGDPSTGSLERISGEVGIIAPEAWAMSPDGDVAFLSNDGVYLWSAGSKGAPVRFSEGRVPGQLRSVSAATNRITMAYDQDGRGYHLFITPDAGTGTHWWLDVENKALWPVLMNALHEPVAVGRVDDGGLAEVILGCSDGYIRKFDKDATDDDGEDLESHVLIGPVRISVDDVRDAVLAEIHGIMADISGEVTWRVVMADSAEVAADTAVAGVASAVAGGVIAGVAASGLWADGRNTVVRPRSRGAWVVVWISAVGKWAYEAVPIVARQLGRLR